MSDRPIEQCYWVEPGKLLAGEYPRTRGEAGSQDKIDALLKAGVSVFIDLTEAGELNSYENLLRGARYLRIPIRDASVPNTPQDTQRALDAIDEHIAAGRIVYVHCWGGIGRTGTIVGCWLAQRVGGVAGLAKLKLLWKQCPKSATRNSPETAAQERYVLNWN